MFFKKRKKEKAFTLMEMLISITLFSIVTTIAFTALYNIMNASEKAKTIKLIVNNLNIAVEGMTRELRVGYEYCDTPTGTGSDCDSDALGSDIIYFTNKDGCEANYEFNRDQKKVLKTIEPCLGNPGISSLPITGDDIEITNLKFYINGVGSVGNIQPRVLILLTGEASGEKINSIFKIQTTVSQRKPEYNT